MMLNYKLFNYQRDRERLIVGKAKVSNVHRKGKVFSIFFVPFIRKLSIGAHSGAFD